MGFKKKKKKHPQKHKPNRRHDLLTFDYLGFTKHEQKIVFTALLQKTIRLDLLGFDIVADQYYKVIDLIFPGFENSLSRQHNL